MSRGIAFSKNKQVKCFSYCSLSPILISLSVASSCVGANGEENWGRGANICNTGRRARPPFGVCLPGCTGGGKNSRKRRSGGSSPHETALSLGEEGDPASTSAPWAQQVIMITTCSRGSFSLIYSLSTYPS